MNFTAFWSTVHPRLSEPQLSKLSKLQIHHVPKSIQTIAKNADVNCTASVLYNNVGKAAIWRGCMAGKFKVLNQITESDSSDSS